jgi:hypothetical protein
VDHFFATSPDAEALMVIFRDTLGMPEQWPFRRYGSFASGGVSLGNVVFEFVEEGPGGLTEFGWLAFEPVPATQAAVLELDRRGVAHDAPAPTFFPDSVTGGEWGWVNTTLKGLAGPGVPGLVFLCDYVPRQPVRDGQERARADLVKRGGGPLGILGVAEILFGATDLEAARREWRKLLDSPAQERDDRFTFGAGPSIRLVQADKPGIQRIILQVRSIDSARAYLRQSGLIRETHEGEIAIDSTVTRGLEIVLSDQYPRH